MDFDPVAELLPPRYAIESDDEDEFNPLHQQHPSSPETKIQVDITRNTDISHNVNLIIASGIAGKTWARGANLEEQSGQVSVNGVQIGLVFNPSWTKSSIIVSEELPLYAMHTYAETILDSFKPLSLSLLDSYPVPTYVTAHPVPFHEAPIRYLTTSPKPDLLDNKAELLTPPNLIQATSASFLSISSVRNIIATLILLPSPNVPPKQNSSSNLSRLNEEQVEWPPILMRTAQDLLFQALGEPSHVWEYVDVNPRQDKTTKKRTQVGEGGMYM